MAYRARLDGSRGPAEINRLLKRHGDIIIAINGKSVLDKTFKEVVSYLKESREHICIRFCRDPGRGGFTTSCGGRASGNSVVDNLQARQKCGFYLNEYSIFS